jgi:acetolactate synthase-1/2/3 large subunit
MAEMTGGEAVVAALAALSVDAVFGVPSMHNLPIVEALSRADRPRFWLARHEQGATHMADAYGRVSGGLAVALSSTGPGAGNSVTALLEASDANSPLLAITGQVATRWLERRRGALHDAQGQPQFLASVTKGVYRPLSVEEIPWAIFEAAERAVGGRPGPVAVEIPIDLQYARADVEIPRIVRRAPKSPRAEDIAAAVDLILGARRVVVWAGGGAVRADAGPVLKQLMERLGAPLVTSYNGRGVVDERHPLVIGAFTTVPEVRRYLEAADVWIAVGTRFRDDATAEWALKPPKALIHINVDRTERDRNYPAAVFVEADARLAVEALLEAIPGPARTPDPEGAALARTVREAAFKDLGPWRPWAEAITEALDADGILVCDATIAAYAFGQQVIPLRRSRSSLYPTTSAIGPGLPMALGAQVAAPDRPVVALCGDGGFLLDIGDLATAAQHRLPVVFLVFNDRAYGILRRIQRAEFGHAYAVDLNAPDFVAVAKGFGLDAYRATQVDDLKRILAEAQTRRGPVLVDIDVNAVGPVPLAGYEP